MTSKFFIRSLTYYSKEIFEQQFSRIFQSYQSRLEDNDYDCFRRKEKGDDVRCLSDEEFLKIYGEPPWIYVNKIFEEAKLDFTITFPPQDADRNSSFKAELINKTTGDTVGFSYLSSGEKVILSLILALYNSALDVEFPEILLMDEPDASLHPSMTKQFLDVIENIFVKEKGVKVIMTTHSPSTVALAPESSLFVIKKTGKRIEKIKKDKAVKILTAGVPSLSAHYEHRRQVFVESEVDEFIYGKIYEKLKDKLENEISLNFIPSGIHQNGSCAHVIKIVNLLTGAGNKYVFGIIDWGGKNNGNDYVRVFGKDKRYCIENYIFDPILLAAFLLYGKYIKPEKLGLTNEHYTDFRYFTQTKFQTIADHIFDRVKPLIKSSDEMVSSIKYLDKFEIEIPHWYLTCPGHDLANHVIKAFSELGKYKEKPNDLTKDIVRIILDDVPQLIHSNFLELFRDIQDY